MIENYEFQVARERAMPASVIFTQRQSSTAHVFVYTCNFYFTVISALGLNGLVLIATEKR